MSHYYLEKPIDPGEHDFALIDRLQYPDISKTWPVLELVSPMLKPQAHLYPWLLPLKELSAGEWKALMQGLVKADAPQTRPVSCLLLRSEQSSSEIRNQLIRSLYFTDEKHQGHILRYYDPRVLFHLCWMLSPGLLVQTFSPQTIDYWTFWLEGHWHTVSFSSANIPLSGDVHPLSRHQLQRCGLINQVLSKCEFYRDLAQRELVSQRIDALLVKAAALGLPTDEDKVAFAFHGLRLRDAFWTSPQMASLLLLAKKTPNFFHDETQLWDEKRWHAMTQR
ncbi:DUF4123 domain-containing protein [Cedecea neteri]|uniref:DUF4123 domain-containing protein n=1 Tax=Cedecea neteri TaxID=158822 RepID=UPI0004F849DA|nr:DUF4123 domain-containing protein [Cedecea neteri]AIR66363.1 hypothetical protein LH86_15065 [Cedecea neteri]